MIIGKGLLAKAFMEFDREQVLFFASGVSNSLETDAAQFEREKNLLLQSIKENPDLIFVYFSTCSIYDSSKNDSLYVNHKLNMEQLVSANCQKYLIARVSNAVGFGGNQHLLMNYLSSMIKSHQPLTIHKNATRNLIDVEDVRGVVLQLLDLGKYNRIYNIAYVQNFGILEIVESFEANFGTKSQLEIMDLGESYSIDIHEINQYFEDINPSSYLDQLIRKYFMA